MYRTVCTYVCAYSKVSQKISALFAPSFAHITLLHDYSLTKMARITLLSLYFISLLSFESVLSLSSQAPRKTIVTGAGNSCSNMIEFSIRFNCFFVSSDFEYCREFFCVFFNFKPMFHSRKDRKDCVLFIECG